MKSNFEHRNPKAICSSTSGLNFSKAIGILPLILSLLLISCEKSKEENEELTVINAEIIVLNSGVIWVNDTICFIAMDSAIRSKQLVKPMSYSWWVEDSVGELVDVELENNDTVYWLAEEAGNFRIGSLIRYPNSKVPTEAFCTITVSNDPRSVYCGEYHFVRVISYWGEHPEDHPTETSFYEGSITPYGDQLNKVRINCGEEKILNTYSENFVANLQYSEGEEHPHFSLGERAGGRFNGPDSVTIIVETTALGAGYTWSYYGKKKPTGDFLHPILPSGPKNSFSEK